MFEIQCCMHDIAECVVCERVCFVCIGIRVEVEKNCCTNTSYFSSDQQRTKGSTKHCSTRIHGTRHTKPMIQKPNANTLPLEPATKIEPSTSTQTPEGCARLSTNE